MMRRTPLKLENSKQRMVRIVGGHYFQGTYWQGITLYEHGQGLSATAMSKAALQKAKAQHERWIARKEEREYRETGQRKKDAVKRDREVADMTLTEQVEQVQKALKQKDSEAAAGSEIIDGDKAKKKSMALSLLSTATISYNKGRQWNGSALDLDTSLPTYDMLLNTNPGAFELDPKPAQQWTETQKRAGLAELMNAPDRPPMGQVFFILSHPEEYKKMLRSFDHDVFFEDQMKHLTGYTSLLKELPEGMDINATTPELLGAAPIKGLDFDPIEEIQRLEAADRKERGLLGDPQLQGGGQGDRPVLADGRRVTLKPVVKAPTTSSSTDAPGQEDPASLKTVGSSEEADPELEGDDDNFDRYLNITEEDLKTKLRPSGYNDLSDLFVWWDESKFLINNEASFTQLCDAIVDDATLVRNEVMPADSAHSLLTDIRQKILASFQESLDKVLRERYETEEKLRGNSTPSSSPNSSSEAPSPYHQRVVVPTEPYTFGNPLLPPPDAPRDSTPQFPRAVSTNVGPKSRAEVAAAAAAAATAASVQGSILPENLGVDALIAPRQIGITYSKQASIAASREHNMESACLYLYQAACYMPLTHHDWEPVFFALPSATPEEMEVVKRLVTKIRAGPNVKAMSALEKYKFVQDVVVPFAAKHTKIVAWKGRVFIAVALFSFVLLMSYLTYYRANVRGNFYEHRKELGHRGAGAEAQDLTLTPREQHEENLRICRATGDFMLAKQFTRPQDVDRYFENQKREEKGLDPIPDPRDDPKYRKMMVDHVKEAQMKMNRGDEKELKALPSTIADSNHHSGREWGRYSAGQHEPNFAHYKTAGVGTSWFGNNE